jgi:serine/threonine-protein kinase HipA
LALTLNGKKKNLRKGDFVQAMQSGGINVKAIENIFSKFEPLLVNWHKVINAGFLEESLRNDYHSLIDKKFKQLYLI